MTTSATPEKKKGMSTFKKILIFVVIIVVVNAISRRNSNGTIDSSVVPTAVTAADVVVKPHSSVTMTAYNSLKDGMSYKDACAILGESGEEISSNAIGGTKTVMYKWEGPGFGANMNAMFQNDKLMSKAQFGLK